MERFRLKAYDIKSEKIKKGPLRIHFLTDLHGISFGRDNDKLLRVIENRNPHAILIGGDMGITNSKESFHRATALVKQLSYGYPVYYVYGNHEMKFMESQVWSEEARGYKEFLKYHCTLLESESSYCDLQGEKLIIHGLNPEQKYYRKPFPAKMTVRDIEKSIGKADQEGYHILLAHNPKYGNEYFQWGADLILSGHYHGGLWRFSENRGLVSTHFHPFPKYCCGIFRKGEQTMIVSAGLGEHTIRMRIHNPRELIEINLSPRL